MNVINEMNAEVIKLYFQKTFMFNVETIIDKKLRFDCNYIEKYSNYLEVLI